MYCDEMWEETNWIEAGEREGALKSVKDDEKCRREGIQLYLKGIKRNCMLEKDGEVCDICEKMLKGGKLMRKFRGIKRRRGQELEMKEARLGSVRNIPRPRVAEATVLLFLP